MVRPAQKRSRQRGSIRRRGNSYLVEVYAGIDPLTGQRLYLNGSLTDPNEAERIRTRLLAQVDEQRHAKTKGTLRTAITEWLDVHEVEATTKQGYESYLRLHVGPALGDQPVGKITARVLEKFYAELRRCKDRCDGRPYIEHRLVGPHECRTVRHRRPPGRQPATGYPPHDCGAVGCIVTECQQHVCRPLANSTILKIHAMIGGALSAAVRWEWIGTNVAVKAKKPRQPTPQPKPPTPEQAARLINESWSEDEAWGTLVWLVMVTGLRRAELLALRWADVDLIRGKVHVSRNYVVVKGERIIKDTKSHQVRRLSLDPATVGVLQAHRQRYESIARHLGNDVVDQPDDETFVFSYHPTHERPYNPDGITHRYERMCERLGFDSHLHALRHYSATELLTAGVDLRTVAGRLGHSGGGTTTLCVYAAWVEKADEEAASILGGRIKPPGGGIETAGDLG